MIQQFPYQLPAPPPPNRKQTQKDACATMFTATLVSIAKKQKQPKGPPTDKWMNKIRYMPTMEYNPAIKKKDEVLILAAEQIYLEDIMTSEISQTHRRTNIEILYDYMYMKYLEQVDLQRQKVDQR